MDSPPPDFRLLRFGSDSFAPDKRAAIWQDMLSRKLVSVVVQQLTNQPFQIDASLRILPECRFGMAISGASTFRRTPELVAADNNDVLIVISMEGTSKFATATEEITLEEGDGYFLSCRQEGSFTWNYNTRFQCLRLKRSKLSALVENLDDLLGRVIPRGTESLKLLSGYMRCMDDYQNLTTPELRNLATTHIYELATMALHSLSATVAKPQANALGTMWPRAIKKYIADKLDLQSLSIAQVARAHRLSPRHVQRILEAEGTTFSEFVLGKRLERTHAILSDPRQSHRPIGEVALANGFGDVSHFNRAFRRRYGASPSEIRKKNLLLAAREA